MQARPGMRLAQAKRGQNNETPKNFPCPEVIQNPLLLLLVPYALLLLLVSRQSLGGSESVKQGDTMVYHVPTVEQEMTFTPIDIAIRSWR